MDITIVISQMCVMLIIIFLGYFLFKKNRLEDGTSRQISGLVVNICNPAVLVCSAFDKTEAASLSQLFTGLMITILLYLILLFAGFAIPRILRIEEKERYMYHLLTVYGNVGFLGIPLVSAVLGSQALIYVSINCVIYNMFFYITATAIIRKAAARELGREIAFNKKELLGRLVNSGTVSAVLTIILYLADFSVPSVISETLNYAGRCTTFLSMLVLGVSVAQMPLKSIFSHGKDYLFIALRMVFLPIACVLLLRQLSLDPLFLGTCALLLAAPAGNLPLMCAKENGLSPEPLARNIILSTLLSVLTIPIVALFA